MLFKCLGEALFFIFTDSDKLKSAFGLSLKFLMLIFLLCIQNSIC